MKSIYQKLGLLSLTLIVAGPAFAGTTIEEREYVTTERLVETGECVSKLYGGRVPYTDDYVDLVYERSYQKYLVEVTQDGWFGEKTEKLIEATQAAPSTRLEVEKKSFTSEGQCKVWVKALKADRGPE